MRPKFIASIVLLLFVWTLQAQNIVGKVTDNKGNPVASARVEVNSVTGESVLTDKEGIYSIKANIGDILLISTNDGEGLSIQIKSAQCDVVIHPYDEIIERGFGIRTTQKASTLSTASATFEQMEKFSAINPVNALYGLIPGLTILSNGGPAYNSQPTIQLRGIGTTGNASPLILVDGIERPIERLSVSEIENVTVLKDAAAVAIYGMRAANGVILVTTKRGEYGKMKVDVKYQHGFTKPFRLPKMVNAPTYALALNEALRNDGLSPKYTEDEIELFRNGSNPDLYPNVNWLDEATRNKGDNNELDLTFSGGNERFRYFSNINYANDFGLINPIPSVEDYNTALNFYKLNLRVNLDFKLTATTKIKLNIMGSIDDYNRPNIAPNTLFQRTISIPSAAFPVKTSSGQWGGNLIYKNTNPAASIAASGFTRSQNRLLFADLVLTQDLSVFLKGLSAEVGVGYDNKAEYLDTQSRTFIYEYAGTKYGENTELSFNKSLNSMYMNSTLYGKVNYFTQNAHSQFNALLLYFQEDFQNKGRNTHVARQSMVASASWALYDKYFLDATASYAGSSYLSKGDKFRLYPAVSAGWLLSSEKFFPRSEYLDLLKLRASFGLSGNDRMSYELDRQFYTGGDNYYFGNGSSVANSLKEGQMATRNLEPELSRKVNVGLDLIAFKGLNLSIDAFYDYRKNILVAGSPVISQVLGAVAPMVNKGIVENKGIEASLTYTGKVGDLNYNIGGNFAFARNKIIESGEGYQPYDYLYNRGNSIGAYRGLQSNGFFADEADIQQSKKQSFSVVRPGDIKYVDINNDDQINEYDQKVLGYSTRAPEIYYGFNVAADYKGLGFSAQFQGIEHFQVARTTDHIYWTLQNNGNISDWYYNGGRWTSENRENAKLPRLTTQGNNNNFRANDIWMADGSYLKLRSLEIYYSLPSRWIKAVKLSKVKLFARGMNLFSIDHIKDKDPEYMGNEYPTLSSYHLGASLSF